MEWTVVARAGFFWVLFLHSGFFFGKIIAVASMIPFELSYILSSRGEIALGWIPERIIFLEDNRSEVPQLSVSVFVVVLTGITAIVTVYFFSGLEVIPKSVSIRAFHFLRLISRAV